MQLIRHAKVLVAAIAACSILATIPASDVSARIEPNGSVSILQEVLPDGGFNRQVEIAYNPDLNQYLAVWRTSITFGPDTVYSSVLDASGTPTGSPVVLADNVGRGSNTLTPGGTSWRPDVSYNPVTKQYLVTIMRDFVEPRNSGILGILVSDTGAMASAETSISEPQGSENGDCVAAFPDAVADPVTGGYKIAYALRGEKCAGPGMNWISVIQPLGADLSRGSSVRVPTSSVYPITPRIAYNPAGSNFLVAITTHDDTFSVPQGFANIYTSSLASVSGPIEVVHDTFNSYDIGGVTVPIADPATGNWVVFYDSPRFEATRMNVFTSTGAKVGDAAIVRRGNISAVSAIGDATILVSNVQGPLQQLRQDGSEIHWIRGPLAVGNVGVPNTSIANGDPDDSRAGSIGLDPTTSATASTSVRLFAPGPLPVAPARLLDTRPGQTTVDGLALGGGKQSAGTVLALQVAGRGNVPTDASAALLNVTAAGANAVGFVTTYPCDAASRPTTSNLNYSAGGAASSAAITKLSATGTVCIVTSVEAHLIVDVNGYIPRRASVTPVVPARLLDTRPTGITIDSQRQGIGRIPADSTTTLQVTGRGGVDPTADAVLVTVTAIRPEQRAFLTIYPCDAARPTAANLNAAANSNVANLVTSKTSSTGTICIYSSAATDLAVDVAAYVPDNGGLLPILPSRLVDTRTGPGTSTIDGSDQGGGRISAGTTTEYTVDRGDIPPGATGVMLNVAAIRPDNGGFMTLFPSACDSTRPTTSNVNFAAGDVVSNAVFVKTGDLSQSGTRSICVYTSANTDIAVDAVAYTVDT